MRIEDDLLDKLGDYYASDYVEINQPWIRDIPFHEWAERQIKEGGKNIAIRFPICA